jgi:hypothetical protein
LGRKDLCHHGSKLRDGVRIETRHRMRFRYHYGFRFAIKNAGKIKQNRGRTGRALLCAVTNAIAILTKIS